MINSWVQYCRHFVVFYPADDVSRRQVNRLLPMFIEDEGLLRYENKLCVPRRCVSRVLQMEHDSRIGGHFGHAKTMSRLANFYWRHKSRDVKLYVQGCLKCQQCKDSRQKPLTDPTPLELPERRWDPFRRSSLRSTRYKSWI
jgi:hypothetical protein